MRQACCWLVLSVLFLQTSQATSIVWVVSANGEYVVVAADSGEDDGRKPNDHACKVIAFDDTVFFASGRPRIPMPGGTTWDSIQTAWEVYRTSLARDTESLSKEWGNCAMNWFFGQNPTIVKSLTGADGTLVQGGFINFVPNTNPVVFSQELYFLDGPPTRLFLKPSSYPMGLGGATGVDNHDLIEEFREAKTPRAHKAYGKLKPNGVGKNLAYDKEFVAKAVQFVIDNVPDKDKHLVHGPIDVVVIRRGGVEWGPRKANCYAHDFHSPKKSAKR